MRVIDLSHPLVTDMPVYPGDRAVRVAQRQVGHLITVTELELTAHAGTHVDAPAHMLRGEPTLGRLAPDRFLGRAMVLEIVNPAPRPIQARELAAFGAPKNMEYTLIRTGWDTQWGSGTYFTAHPWLSPEAAEYLAELAGRGLKGVGVDAPSLDRADSRDYPVHCALLRAGLVLVENLRGLHRAGPEEFLFSCLPLNIATGDGSPVRAVAILNEDYPAQTALA